MREYVFALCVAAIYATEKTGEYLSVCVVVKIWFLTGEVWECQLEICDCARVNFPEAFAGEALEYSAFCLH